MNVQNEAERASRVILSLFLEQLDSGPCSENIRLGKKLVGQQVAIKGSVSTHLVEMIVSFPIWRGPGVVAYLSLEPRSSFGLKLKHDI